MLQLFLLIVTMFRKFSLKMSVWIFMAQITELSILEDYSAYTCLSK